MTAVNWTGLAVTTVRDPAEAARQLLAMNFPREVLWLALALAIVLDTLLHAVRQMILAQSQGPVPGVELTPMGYGVIVGAGLVLSVLAISQVGRMMGGQGRFDDVLVLLAWIQLLSAAIQAAVLLLAVTIPPLAMLLSLAGTILVLYVFLHFIDQAHRLGSLWRAAGVLVASIFAITLAILVLLTLVGGQITGAGPHV